MGKHIDEGFIPADEDDSQNAWTIVIGPRFGKQSNPPTSHTPPKKPKESSKKSKKRSRSAEKK